jgi:CRP-like cAMP-binding protein
MSELLQENRPTLDSAARLMRSRHRSDSRAKPDPFIAKLAMLAPLTEAEKEVLAEAASRTVTISADQDIVREGETSGECRVLLDGWSARYKLLPEGKRQIVAFGLPGDVLDLDAFVTGTAMDHTVTTLCPCTLAVVPHATMREIVSAHPGVAQALWRNTLLDAAVYREWVVNVGRRSAHQRIAHLMCETYTRLAAVGRATDDGEGRGLTWPVTQTELGDATGLSTVHVNRTLQALRCGNLITLKGSDLSIEDWPALVRLGGFDPAYITC